MASAAAFVLAKFSPIFLLAYAEDLYSTPEVTKRAQGLVILSNLILASFTLVGLGFRVGKARKEFQVPLPHMYADPSRGLEGEKFNNVQRGHQQALETFPTFLALSFVSGQRFPITTALLGVFYAVSRVSWANAYTEFGAEGRYSKWFGKQVWAPLVLLSATSAFVALEQLLGW
ncbi:hypothetical protein BASA81_010284 [Batrachochytrium salamandrivorans]|nr:hypothetical protein BASA81_010284 [Batrachochytrium salamandrivorans]